MGTLIYEPVSNKPLKILNGNVCSYFCRSVTEDAPAGGVEVSTSMWDPGGNVPVGADQERFFTTEAENGSKVA